MPHLTGDISPSQQAMPNVITAASYFSTDGWVFSFCRAEKRGGGISAHTFQSLVDGTNIRSSISQQRASGINIRLSIQHQSQQQAIVRSDKHEAADDPGMGQQEAFAHNDGLEVSGRTRKGIARERRHVYITSACCAHREQQRVTSTFLIDLLLLLSAI